MKKMSAHIGAATVFMLMPVIALAQTTVDADGELEGFLESFTSFINDVLIPLIFAIALLVFLYGVFRFFIAGNLGGNADDNREQGKKLMLYSILGFVLMVSIFGIVNLIAGGLGLTGGESEVNLPGAPSSGS